VATISGTLIAESLKTGVSLEGVPLMIDKIVRAEVGDVEAGQPLTWTFIEFQLDLDHVDAWVDSLREVLDERGGWYCDFRSSDETFVAFAGTVFRYPRGDAAGRARASDHARSIGVPVAQIDWRE
jgi:hypothetical protein